MIDNNDIGSFINNEIVPRCLETGRSLHTALEVYLLAYQVHKATHGSFKGYVGTSEYDIRMNERLMFQRVMTLEYLECGVTTWELPLDFSGSDELLEALRSEYQRINDEHGR